MRYFMVWLFGVLIFSGGVVAGRALAANGDAQVPDQWIADETWWKSLKPDQQVIALRGEIDGIQTGWMDASYQMYSDGVDNPGSTIGDLRMEVAQESPAFSRTFSDYRYDVTSWYKAHGKTRIVSSVVDCSADVQSKWCVYSLSH